MSNIMFKNSYLDMQGTFNLGVQNSFTEQVYNELKQLNDRSSATLVLNRDLGAYLFMDINNILLSMLFLNTIAKV